MSKTEYNIAWNNKKLYIHWRRITMAWHESLYAYHEQNNRQMQYALQEMAPTGFLNCNQHHLLHHNPAD